jgi:thiamine-monophosphate kinase
MLRNSSRKLIKSDPLPPEDELVARLIEGLPQTVRTLAGPGDDCAVICIPGADLLQLFKTDAMVEGIHFTRSMSAAAVGRKALARAVSDIASMGGSPCEALITLVLPPDVPFSWVEELYRGMSAAARLWSVGLAGGETTSAPRGAPIMISMALTGEVAPAHLVRRSGAKAGEWIVVTGCLGRSFASGWHLEFEPRLKEAQAVAAWFQPGAMMDLSDGLAKDLPRLVAASQAGWQLDLASLPLRSGATLEQALGDGEDYELLFTVPETVWPSLARFWKESCQVVPLTRIGRIAESGVRQPELSGGWDHFAGA